jgi:hypothetical protein
MADKKISALTAASTPLGGTEVVPLVQSSTTKNVSIANLTAGRAVSAASLSTTGNIVSDTLLRVTGAGQIEQNGGTGGLYFLNIATSGGATNQRFLTTNASGVAQLQLQLAGGTNQINNLYGDTRLETGNLVIGTSGKGIDFSATGQAAGMTSELLADYEEGTWTPTITDASLNATMSGNNFGTYTKIGRLVTVQMYVETTSVAALNAAGAVYISGWPFSITTSGGSCASRGSGLNIGANQTMTLSRWAGTLARIAKWDAATGTSFMTVAEWSDDGAAFWTMSYET